MVPSHPNPRYVRLGLAFAVLTLLLSLTACVTTIRQIDKAKDLQNNAKFEELADLKISCTADEEGCNQVHLLKGDACFRLAKQASDHNKKRARLDCAVTELSAGLDMTKDWSVAKLDRAQFYANDCEAARLRADFGERQRFEGILANRARQFIAFAPDNPGAVYYNARAEFYTLTQAAQPCNGLRALGTRLAGAMQRFGNDPHYSTALQSLKATVGVETHTRCRN